VAALQLSGVGMGHHGQSQGTAPSPGGPGHPAASPPAGRQQRPMAPELRSRPATPPGWRAPGSSQESVGGGTCPPRRRGSQPCHRLVPRSSRSSGMVQPWGPGRTGAGGSRLTSPARCVVGRGKQPDHQQRLSLAGAPRDRAGVQPAPGAGQDWSSSQVFTEEAARQG